MSVRDIWRDLQGGGGALIHNFGLRQNSDNSKKAWKISSSYVQLGTSFNPLALEMDI